MATNPTPGDPAVVRRLMAEQQLTEHALAVRTGIALSTLRRRLAGADFTAAELRAIAVALDTTAAAILAEAERGAA